MCGKSITTYFKIFPCLVVFVLYYVLVIIGSVCRRHPPQFASLLDTCLVTLFALCLLPDDKKYDERIPVALMFLQRVVWRDIVRNLQYCSKLGSRHGGVLFADSECIQSDVGAKDLSTSVIELFALSR